MVADSKASMKPNRFIYGTVTIEGAPHLDPEHLSVSIVPVNVAPTARATLLPKRMFRC